MSNKLLLGAIASAIAVIATPGLAQTRHVVEMFTSQGCSSCPPADAVLNKLKGRGDVLALGFHVDYWDRLGWKDTLGSNAYTQRQRSYARGSDGRVYTPQAVVDGKGRTVGSRSGEVNGLLRGELPINVAIDNGSDVKVGSGSGSATVWRVDFTSNAAVSIARGENRGKTITYVNAVRGMTKLGAWNGKSASYKLGACGSAQGADNCAVIVQSGSGTGRILGAAQR